MACFASHFSFILCILFLASPYIEAREGKVFINTIDVNSEIGNINVKGSSVHVLESPTPSSGSVISQASILGENDQIALTPINNEFPLTPVEKPDNVYGLYGRRSFNDQILSKKITSTLPSRVTSDNINANDEENEEEEEDYGNNYKNNGYSTYNNNESGHLSSKYYNKGYTNGYNGNGYVERQGMSDTRFLENGKYYYDVNNENYSKNGYESVRKGGNNGGYYYGEKSKYEFDSMEEYERQQGYSNTQREYVP